MATSLPKKPEDATDKLWEELRPAPFVDDKKIAKLDGKVVGALKDWKGHAESGAEAVIASGDIETARKATDAAKKALNDAAKAVKKDRDAKDVVDAFLDVVEDFGKELEKSVGDTGHSPEFLAVRTSYDSALKDDIKKTTSGPKPYKLVFRNYAGKKDAFLFLVFRTGKVRQVQAKQLELAFRGAVGQTFESIDGVVRKDGTKFIFEYPTGTDLPEKLVKQMKLELGLKAEFESVSSLSEIVEDDGTGGDAAEGDAAAAAEAPPADGGGAEFDDAAWKAATDAWREAMDTVNDQIGRLGSALRETGDPELEEIAEFGLSGVSADNIRVPLQTAILEINGSEGPDRAKHATAARERVAAFLSHLDDERVAACDGNEWAPTTIKATLSPALENLDRVLASVG